MGMKKHGIFFLLVLVMMALDQLSKFIVLKVIPLYTHVRVIPGFFDLTHVRNRGAIFGFFAQSGNRLIHYLLLAASLAALGMIIYYFFKTSSRDTLLKFSLSLVLAGALGNLLDRIFRGYVIDFLDVYIKNRHWPTFNVADSCISVGAFFLILVFFFRK